LEVKKLNGGSEGLHRPEKKGKNMLNEQELKDKVIAMIQEIHDPEIPVNIWDLGLIYEVNILPINNVEVVMTLTAPSCPAAQSLPHEVDQKIRTIEGVNDVHVEVTWTPSWNKDMMSEVAKLELGFM
jgi:FeS assembly SUF system protein